MSSGPWIALFILAVLIYIQLALRGGAMLYYFTHFVRRPNLSWHLGPTELSISWFGLFNGIGLCATMIGVFLAKPLAERFGKRRTFQACLVISAVLMALFATVPSGSLLVLFTLQILMQLAFGPTIPMLWTMMADVADYAEWKTGRRSTALAFASIVFGLKLGFGLGAWISGEWLEYVGYLSANDQTATAIRGIVLLVSVFPATAVLAGFLVLFFYRIDDELDAQVKQTLRQRRQSD